MPRIQPGSGGSASSVSDSAVATQVTSGTQTQAALRAAFVPFWTAAETVTAGTVRMTASGQTITRNANGTTRPSYDATEQALWTVTSAGGGGGAITSVNGKTGVVVLSASDVGADAAGAAASAAAAITPTGIGAVVQSATGVPDPSAVYEPVHRPTAPRPQPAAILTEFQPGHGFTATAGTLTDDTAVYAKGTQSASYVTDGTATYANITSPTLPAFDLTAKVLRVTFRVEDTTKLGGLQVTVGTDSTFSNGYYWQLQLTDTLAQKVAYSGEWVSLTLSFHDAVKYGAGAKVGLTAFRFQIKDKGAGVTATLHLQAAETVADGTSVFPNGVVVLCADDAYASFMALGKSYIDGYGYPVTYYPIIDKLGGSGRTTVQALLDAQKLGSEVGAHSFTDATHSATFTGMTAAALDADLRQNKAWLIANGFRGSSHSAFPKGQDGLTTDGIPVRSILARYFATARSTSQKLKETFPVADPLRIRAISSITSYAGGYNPTLLTQAGGDLDQCKATGSVLVLTFHEIVGDGAQTTGNQCGLTEFRSVIDGIHSRGIPVLTMGELLRTPLVAASSGSGAAIEAASLPKREAPTAATGTGTTASAWDHVHPRGFWAPEDQNLITWSYDPIGGTASQIPTAGQLQIARVHIPVATTVTSLTFFIATAGATLTAGQCLAALYTAAGTLVGQTADQSTSWNSSGLKTMPLTTPQAVAAGDYYMAFYWNGTTGPTIVRAAGNSLVNAGVSSSNTRFGIADTGLTTTPPATMGARTSASNSWWVTLS